MRKIIPIFETVRELLTKEIRYRDSDEKLVAKVWHMEMTQICNPEPFNFTTFENEGNKDEMIIVSNIPFFSLCEHHLAPFMGFGSIAYLPTKKIVGLSKLPRTLDHFSRRFQNQERITHQISEFLMEQLKPKGVAVVLRARHLCVEMRGVQKHDVFTTTSSMTGLFKADLNCRQEFLKLSQI